MSTLPGSGSFGKKLLDIKKVKGKILSRQHVRYVLGISGGDCAGKKQLINFMFPSDQHGNYSMVKDNKGKQKQQVTIIREDYFLTDKNLKFKSRGYNWIEFQRAILSLFAGNDFTLKNIKLTGTQKILKPNRLLVLEGSHIFMQSLPIHNYMDAKVFIDSDSDIRLSRRVFKDTQENGIELKQSIKNYLGNIKPSYEEQIQPCKTMSDIILPHLGVNFYEHHKKDKVHYETNIRNANDLLMAKIREEMAKQVSK